METAINTCTTCKGTGWDDAFSSPCAECDAELPTLEAQGEAKEAYDRAIAKVESEELSIIDALRKESWDFPQSLVRQYESKGSLTIKQWAAARKIVARAQSTEPRWTKVGEVWAVRAPGATSGDIVTVTTKAGKVSEVALGEELVEGTFAPVERAEPEIPAGIYEVDGIEYKVQASRTTGKLYAKVRDEYGDWEYVGRDPLPRIAEVAAQQVAERKAEAEIEAGISEMIEALRERFGITQTVGFAIEPYSGTNDLSFYNVTKKNFYQVIGGQGRVPVDVRTARSVLRRVAEMSDDEVAAAIVLYGQELGRCGHCGRELTDQQSRADGIGPKCALGGY